jgi:hypothetical protein
MANLIEQAITRYYSDQPGTTNPETLRPDRMADRPRTVCAHHHQASIATRSGKPFFYIILSDRDEWAVEVEWSDSTLERVSAFSDHSAAANWVANQSEAWLAARRIEDIAMELRQDADATGDPQLGS